ncbi:MAG TPA: ion channel [Chitinophagales bacterium]|nr:ion channel [Chitinophagales bacterium]
MSKIRNAIDRMKAGEDIGLGSQKGRQRTVNADGTYNIDRVNSNKFTDFLLYRWLITTSWKHYWMAIVSFYIVDNIVFGSIYYWMGSENLSGIVGTSEWDKFMSCFFFSCQTFTTVGYGGLHPVGKIASATAAIEAFLGLMMFAVATGSLYGRFSKPVSRIKYSANVIIAPYKGITGMQFMVANGVETTLMEMEARVNISWMDEDDNGRPIRRFQQCKLEYDKIAMFPTSWVINHPIDEESALYGKTLEEIKKLDFEIFVLLKGFDDVFSQTIYSRHSFIADQFVFGAKFRKPFSVNEEGRIAMDLTKVGEYDAAPLPGLSIAQSA